MKDIRVLIVDDSLVFRSQLRAALDGVSGVTVVGAAANGRLALDFLSKNEVDLVTLDLEMPELNGLQTLSEMKLRKFPAKVIVFSSLTTTGAELALEALRRGAHDVVAKPTGTQASLTLNQELIRAELVPKIQQFTQQVRPRILDTTQRIDVGRLVESQRPTMLLVGSSTGGPEALEKLLTSLPRPLPFPILIVQHMPPVFTASLAKRLEAVSGVPAAEGVHWEIVQPDRIYVAPGDYHMRLVKADGDLRISLDQGPKVQSTRPAVDVLFETATQIPRQRLLSIILTGMGEDGARGVNAVKNSGGTVLIQNPDSCVVFGMPGAVHRAGDFHGMGDPAQLREWILRACAANARAISETLTAGGSR